MLDDEDQLEDIRIFRKAGYLSLEMREVDYLGVVRLMEAFFQSSLEIPKDFIMMADQTLFSFDLKPLYTTKAVTDDLGHHGPSLEHIDKIHPIISKYIDTTIVKSKTHDFIEAMQAKGDANLMCCFGGDLMGSMKHYDAKALILGGSTGPSSN